MTLLCQLEGFRGSPGCFVVSLRGVSNCPIAPLSELRPIFKDNQVYVTFDLIPRLIKSTSEELRWSLVEVGTVVGSCVVVHCAPLYPLYLRPRPVVLLSALNSGIVKPGRRKTVRLEVTNGKDLLDSFPLIEVESSIDPPIPGLAVFGRQPQVPYWLDGTRTVAGMEILVENQSKSPISFEWGSKFKGRCCMYESSQSEFAKGASSAALTVPKPVVKAEVKLQPKTEVKIQPKTEVSPQPKTEISASAKTEVSLQVTKTEVKLQPKDEPPVQEYVEEDCLPVCPPVANNKSSVVTAGTCHVSASSNTAGGSDRFVSMLTPLVETEAAAPVGHGCEESISTSLSVVRAQPEALESPPVSVVNAKPSESSAMLVTPVTAAANLTELSTQVSLVGNRADGNKNLEPTENSSTLRRPSDGSGNASAGKVSAESSTLRQPSDGSGNASAGKVSAESSTLRQPSDGSSNASAGKVSAESSTLRRPSDGSGNASAGKVLAENSMLQKPSVGSANASAGKVCNSGSTTSVKVPLLTGTRSTEDGIELDPLEFQALPVASRHVPPASSIKLLFKLPNEHSKHWAGEQYTVHVPVAQQLSSPSLQVRVEKKCLS
jgi:hypothetical protein